MIPPDSAARDGRRLPRLHAVTDDGVLGADGWSDRAVSALEAGGARVALHLRGPRAGARRLLALADRLLPHARRAGATLLVNDRVDVALAAGLDGVHLGARSLPPRAVRALIRPGAWVGVSCHGPAELEVAAAEGADYAFLGTIHPTASHPEREEIGLVGLEAAVAAAGPTPVIGIGGIGAGDVEMVMAAGAWGVAAVSGIWAAPDPATAVRQYLEMLGE